jgi:predicted nucleotidyltransferase
MKLGGYMAHTVLLTTVYGSHLYGTSTPESDRDFKQIHMNSTDVILIGKEIKCFNRNSNANGKNTSEDIDFESKELKHFIKEALSGQTYAIDLLHTPRELMITTSPLWEEILANKNKLITRNIALLGSVQRGDGAGQSRS